MTIAYQDAAAENQPITITLFDPPAELSGWYTCCRVDRDTLPDGWTAYDMREGDDGEFCSLEDHVLVNHGGTVLVHGAVAMPKDGRLELLKMDSSNKDTARADYSFL